jgi:hypothetical protein
MARYVMRGGDLRGVVVASFSEVGHPVLPCQTAVPEPPGTAMIEALAWALPGLV